MRKILSLFLILLFVFPPFSVFSAAAQTGNLSGRIIVLDAGHGAETTNRYNGYDEGAAMLELTYKIKPLLEAKGATVVLTREDSHSVNLYARPAIINKVSLETLKAAEEQRLESGSGNPQELNNKIAELDRLIETQDNIIKDPDTYAQIYMNAPFDYSYKREISPELKRIFEYQADPRVSDRFLVVSLHSNATATPINESVNGAIMFYSSNKGKSSTYYSNYVNVDRSILFSGLILNKIDGLGIINRGAQSDCWALIREHNLPGVLAENGFHTNQSDRAKLSSDEFLDKLAHAFSDSISEYFAQIGPPILPEEDTANGIFQMYTDIIENEWYYDAVKEMVGNGIFYGISERLFAPDLRITRDVFLTALYRVSKNNSSDENETAVSLADVSADSWAYEPVSWALSNGILEMAETDGAYGGEKDETDDLSDSGDLVFITEDEQGNSMLSPHAGVTREEVAVILHNYLKTMEIPPEYTELYGFDDGADFYPWARDAASVVRETGFISGYNDNMFAPKNLLTRAETAQILLNLINYKT